MINNQIKVERTINLDSKYLTKSEVNRFYGYIMKIKKGQIKWDYLEDSQSEIMLSKIYVCCLLGDGRFIDILKNIENYLDFVPDGVIGELQYSYIDYLNKSSFKK